MSDPADDTPPGDAEQPVPGEAPFNSEHVLVPGESSAGEPGDDGYELANPPEAWKTAGPDWHRVEAMASVTNPDAQSEALAQQRRMKSSKKSGHLKTLILCNLIVFVASVCVMLLELVASRLIAKHVGSSLYTWTSVIGVVLAGITVGNFLGGWLADHFDHEKLLPKLFLLASASSFSVLWLGRLLAGRTRPDAIDWPMWVFLTVAEMFFLPAVMLGTISPVVASMALKRGRKTGMTVGNVYAWGAMGSIVGTFLTGFYLIDAFGTRLIIGGTAGTLAVLGIAIASKQLLYRTAVVCGWLQFLVFTTAAASISSESLGDLGESVGGFVAERDADVVELESWYNDTWSLKLDEALRNRLLKTLHSGSIEGLSEDTQNSLEQWLRSGYRKHLNEEHNAAIEAFIAATKIERESIDEWRIHGEELGRAMHEVGLLLYLRDDLTGEYHDESNYSYVNVHDGFEDQDMVRQLRLDKLVHSYFNPEDPTKLYYEYEQIYAEATHRVTAGWQRETDVELEAFSGLDRIEPSMPDWIWFDAETNRLTAQGIVDEDRRKELMRLAPHGDYWLAVEKLAVDTHTEYWGGLSTVSLETLPPGVSTQKFLLDRLTYSSTFQTLDAFRELSDDDVQQLCNLGDAGKATAWRTAVNQLSHQSRRVNAFFIGGGGFIFPRWLEAEYSSASRIDVAELDPAVKRAVQLHMGLPPDDQTAVHTIIGDARNVVDDLLKTSANGVGQYDFIYGDAFNDFSVPWHLTTREFNQKVRELLNPTRGVYLINVIDIWPRTTITGSFTPATTEPSDTAFPSQLAIDLEVLTDWQYDWQYAPSGFGGLEVLPLTDGDWEFSARGVMPESLRDRLIKSADRNGMAAFREGVEAAYTESRGTQGGRFLSSCVATLAEVFPNVYVFSTAYGPPADTRDTFVVIASLHSLDLESMEATGYHWTTELARTFSQELRYALHWCSFSTTKLSQVDSLLSTAIRELDDREQTGAASENEKKPPAKQLLAHLNEAGKELFGCLTREWSHSGIRRIYPQRGAAEPQLDETDGLRTWIQLAEEAVALQVLAYLQQYLRSMLFGAMLVSLLMSMTLLSYPLQPAQTLLSTTNLMLVMTAGLGLFALWLFERDDFLQSTIGDDASRIPKHLRTGSSMLGYLIPPVLMLIRQFSPETLTWTTTLFEPLMHSPD